MLCSINQTILPRLVPLPIPVAMFLRRLAGARLVLLSYCLQSGVLAGFAQYRGAPCRRHRRLSGAGGKKLGGVCVARGVKQFLLSLM